MPRYSDLDYSVTVALDGARTVLDAGTEPRKANPVLGYHEEPAPERAW